MKRPETILPWLMKYLALAPAAILAALIPCYWVDLPQWDEWDSVKFFERLSQGTFSFVDLFKQVNEYRQFFPNLVCVALGWLTRWDVRYEMAFVFLVACLISLNIASLGRRSVPRNDMRFALTLLIANFIIFSPAQYENWLQGQQLVYYAPIACVTACVLIAYSKLGTVRKFVLCGMLSIISTFSSANGGVCWLVILPVLLMVEHRKNPALVKWLSAGWLIGLALSVALYLHNYHKPYWSPSPLTPVRHPFEAVVYFLSFLGAPVGLFKGKLSLAAGVLMMAAYALCVWYLLRNRRDRTLGLKMIGWLMIGAYSILTAFMTTIGRLGFGPGQSQSARYIGFSAYLLVSLIFLAGVIAADVSQRYGERAGSRLHQVNLVLGLSILILQPFCYFVSIRRMREMKTTLLQAKAYVLLINQTPNSELTKMLYPDFPFLVEKANALDRLGFLRPALIRSNHVRDISETDSAKSDDCGQIQDVKKLDNDQYWASGWATLPDQGRKADAIILAYEGEDHNQIALRVTRPIKEVDLVNAPWQVLFSRKELPKAPTTLTAWAFDANRGKAFRLRGEFQIPGDAPAQNPKPNPGR